MDSAGPSLPTRPASVGYLRTPAFLRAKEQTLCVQTTASYMVLSIRVVYCVYPSFMVSRCSVSGPTLLMAAPSHDHSLILYNARNAWKMKLLLVAKIISTDIEKLTSLLPGLCHFILVDEISCRVWCCHTPTKAFGHV